MENHLNVEQANTLFHEFWGSGFIAYDPDHVITHKFTTRQQFAEWVGGIYMEFPYNLIDDVETASLEELAQAAMAEDDSLDHLIAISGLATGYDGSKPFSVDSIRELPQQCQIFGPFSDDK